jgi:hypothetical protein
MTLGLLAGSPKNERGWMRWARRRSGAASTSTRPCRRRCAAACPLVLSRSTTTRASPAPLCRSNGTPHRAPVSQAPREARPRRGRRPPSVIGRRPSGASQRARERSSQPRASLCDARESTHVRNRHPRRKAIAMFAAGRRPRRCKSVAAAQDPLQIRRMPLIRLWGLQLCPGLARPVGPSQRESPYGGPQRLMPMLLPSV